ncbi:MAG: hypothetical protein EP329_25505 [Deltaproteobacteria bacterium]|nr:MAG: hypothetical protein EP329_25505 [Deltaproteobacteria bacterium]
MTDNTAPHATDRRSEDPILLQCREWINDLLTDPKLLRLDKKLRSSNLFSILGASHRELWHSAFLKWVLDPQTGLGLGAYPLECFLRALPLCGGNAGLALGERMSLQWISETAPRFQFACEFSHQDLQSKRANMGRARIDIFGEALSGDPNHDTPDDERTVLARIIIENKVKASETGDQTEAYHEWAEKQHGITRCKNSLDVFVFLSPFRVPGPKCEQFVVMTYQDLHEYVLRRVRSHPGLAPEAAFLLDHYALNLALPIAVTGNRPMANTHEDMCREVYEAHQEVLDLIYSVVMAGKGGAPSSNSRRTSRSYSVNITDIVEVGGQLTLQKKDGTQVHALVQKDGSIDVVGDQSLTGLTVSAAATKLLERSANGWREWKAIDKEGAVRPLSDLRDAYVLSQSAESDDVP